MIKKMFFAFLAVAFLSGVALAGSNGGYNYITAEELSKRIQNGPSVILVDICPAAQFAKGHIPGAIETNAFPVKKDEEKARLDKAMPKINGSSDDVVILCPKGGMGAKNTYDYFKSKGVPEKRLLILKNGMAGWPYKNEQGPLFTGS